MTSTCRAWGFLSVAGGGGSAGAAINESALEAALQQTLADLPFLAGRMGKMKGMRLDSLEIQHTGEGALLTVAEAPALSLAAAMGPATWPRRRVTISDPALPFYVDQLDPTRRALLRGREPLMKVRLTRVADGAILAVTLCHVLTDGVRWPALMAHLATRYRQHAFGTPPDPFQLLRPIDRRQLSSEHMTGRLQELMKRENDDAANGTPSGAPPAPQRPPFKVQASLIGYWRLASLALAPGLHAMELLMLHIPREQVAALKTLATGHPEGIPSAPTITTGDAVQAVCALLLHAARGRPPLPVAPQCMMVMVQMPIPPGYFGNAVRMLEISLPVGSPQPAGNDWRGALCQLAAAIRRATVAFRIQPELVLAALAEMEAFVAAPAPRMLSFVYGKLLPQVTAATNYMPMSQNLDLGLGTASAYSQQLSLPRARDMAIIRPAMAPYSEGLFAQMALAPRDAERLRAHPLLGQLLPQARWVGTDNEAA